MATILIIDDDPSFRDYLVSLLQRAGYQVRVAESGVDVENILQSEQIAAVVTDLYMPNADGIETTRAVKRVAPELPVIGLTGAHIHGTEVCLRAMIAFGAVAALSKPLNVPAFLSTVRRVIDNPGRNPAITSSAGAVL